jgi:hypothetical protein
LKKCSADLNWNSGIIAADGEQIRRDQREIEYLRQRDERLRRDNLAMSGHSEQTAKSA